MRQKKMPKRIGEYDPLPVHMKDPNGNPINYDEIKARFICEQIFKIKLVDSDRPDIHAADGSLGIEVTSANGIQCKIFREIDGKIVPEIINYNHLEGKKYKCVRNNGMIDPELSVASAETNPNVYKNLIIQALSDKLQKLNGINSQEAYVKFPNQALYITTVADTTNFSISEFKNLFDLIASEQHKYQLFYGCIIIEGIDFLIQYDFYRHQAYFRPDIVKLIPQETQRARSYAIAKYQGETLPQSPAEIDESFINAIIGNNCDNS